MFGNKDKASDGSDQVAGDGETAATATPAGQSDYRAGALDGLPESGRERLARLQEDVKRGFFTSDLSVDEFLLVKESGFEPLGMVIGSSIYHIGIQNVSYNKNVEMTVLTEAMYNARDLAMTRMEEEADQLGADGIVGVRLTIGRYEWGPGTAEFIAVGTAVKHRDGVLHRASNGRPFTSDLSGQDFAKLLRAGYRPVGMTMGNCVYHIAHQGLRQSWRQLGQNVEIPQFTQGLYEARELAMGRMQAEAEQMQAEGMVAVRLDQASHGWGSHIIEFFAIATAVVPTSSEHIIDRPALVLPLG